MYRGHPDRSGGRRGRGGSGGGRGGSLVPHRRGRGHRPGTRAGRPPRDPLPHRAPHRQHVRVPHQLQPRLRHLWQLVRDHGEWYNSLKMYAEVIKTTKQLTAEHNLPFAWDGGHDQILKGLIDQACAVQQGHTAPPARGCGDDVVVYAPGAKNFKFDSMPETGQHIVDAMNTGLGNDPRRAAWYYPAYSLNGRLAGGPPNNYSRTWYYPAPFKPNACADLKVKA